MKVGIDTDKIKNLIESGNRENANILHSPESIHKWVADTVMKEYALKTLFPQHIAKAHLNGDIHLHDLEYAAIRPVCFQHDLRQFFFNGLKVDGNGKHTSVSKPAKHAEVAIQHAAKVMGSAQTYLSGGQSIDEFNIWLAPYMKGLSYDRIKQLMQMFIYEMNQMYVARGGQVCFSTINLETEIPKYLKDKPAAIAGTTKGTYEEYEEETKLMLKALIDVMMQGDAINKPFLFPNFIVKLRENSFKDENKELMEDLHKLSAKWGLPYFLNMNPDWQENNTNAMGCRTRLSGDWTGDAEEDTLRTGNMQWYSINLPRIAYRANGNDEKLFEILHEILDLTKEALLIKHEISKSILEKGIMNFLTQEFNDGSYYRYENTTKSFGFVGLNEMVKYHIGYELHESDEAVKFGEKVIKYMRDYADNLKKETGLRWSVNETPAESTASKFAQLDYKYYKKQTKNNIHGNERNISSLYYTNSSHARVDADISFGQKARLYEKFQYLENGGHMGHFWNMEAYADPEVLMEITHKLSKMNLGFWTYTKNLSICNECNHSNSGIVNKCSLCGSESLEKYSRITGYLQNINNWNNAKKQELIDRKSNRIKGRFNNNKSNE